MKKKFAVVLSGCGAMDGAEISESVTLLVALSQKGCDMDAFAPEINQSEVIDHLTGEVVHGAVRNVRSEAARIVRGDVKILEELDASNYDGIIIAGGFGVAKNLTDFYYKGDEFEVIDSLSKAVLSFHKAGKPIGAMCIAPIVLSKIFPGKGINITFGLEGDVSALMSEKFGIHHHICDVSAATIDDKMKLVTTPAFMYPDPTLEEIALGAVSLVEGMVALSK